MMIREPAVAGMFYPRDPEQCRRELRACLEKAAQAAAGHEPAAVLGRIIGGIVPHAGWVCSGAVAARVFNLVSKEPHPSAVVLFGAVHVAHGPRASFFPSGAWETPLGLVEVDDRLAERLQGHTGLMEPAPHAHDQEHSIEVQVPFIQYLLPDAKIVPIMVPPTNNAAVLGTAVGRACKSLDAQVVFIGSTDLTHYGPGYGFIPAGVGPEGLAWAKNVNDRRMIGLILALNHYGAVEEAEANQNACGAGAVAAAVAACKAYGATRATLLEHTTSFEVLREMYDEPMRDAVGYAALAFD
ncbi:MAG TPA: AmmeMemoRadiSam system protein B [Phycisphaerae bacterium]|nr:AmmeMemoRadiSam system protein B [Phycisphaerae bacterium]